MTKSKEKEPTGQETALVARFITEKTTIKVDQYSLSRGQGIIFLEQDQNSDVMIFLQEELEEKMTQIYAGNATIQVIALLNKDTGSLMISDGNQDNTYGINKTIPHQQRVITAQYGNTHFGFIWGETESEVSQQLTKLQKLRIQRN